MSTLVWIFKAAIMKMLPRAIKNRLGTNENPTVSAKGLKMKEEPNGNFRTEKYNNQNEKLSGWAPQQNGMNRGKNK